MSSSPTSQSVIPAYMPDGRFTTISLDNHAGSIWISTLLCLVYSALVITVRGYLRWKVLNLDDYVIAIATVLQAGEVASLIVALQYGLGQSHGVLDSEQLYNANTATFVGIVLFITSTCFAKLSVILLIMRLFNLGGPRAANDRRTRILRGICFVTIAVVVLWAVGSTIGLTIDCSIPNFVTAATHDTCPNQSQRWTAIGAIDIATELLLVALVVVIVWPVQLQLSAKVSIVLAFASRLPCAVLSGVHMYYMRKYAPSHDALSGSSSISLNAGLAIVPVIVLMQIELCWSLISATIPVLKSFVRSFNGTFTLSADPEFISQCRASRGTSRSRSIGAGTERRHTAELELMPTRVKSTSSMTIDPINIQSPHISRQDMDIDLDEKIVNERTPDTSGFEARAHIHQHRYELSSETVCAPVHATNVGSHTVRKRVSVCDNQISMAYARDSPSQDVRDAVVRKDMQYEVRHELA